MASILFVCMGNICRSPLAEGVFRKTAEEWGIPTGASGLVIDSAGTIGYHAGEHPDPRAIRAAAARGIDISGQCARLIRAGDFTDFDHILAMDLENLTNLQRRSPDQSTGNIRLFMDFAPKAGRSDVPDPYYGDDAGFEDVLDLVEVASAGFLKRYARHFNRDSQY